MALRHQRGNRRPLDGRGNAAAHFIEANLFGLVGLEKRHERLGAAAQRSRAARRRSGEDKRRRRLVADPAPIFPKLRAKSERWQRLRVKPLGNKRLIPLSLCRAQTQKIQIRDFSSHHHLAMADWAPYVSAEVVASLFFE